MQQRQWCFMQQRQWCFMQRRHECVIRERALRPQRGLAFQAATWSG